MRYTRISADCHIDLCWLPPDLFTVERVGGDEGPHALRHRRPQGADVGDEEGREPRAR